MVLYQVILAYDGTDFGGMQRQKNARSVQGEVEQALQAIGWLGRSITFAGRTDAGVHASGQVIAFEMSWAHSPEDLQNALNANLPQDVAAVGVRQALPGFHPRFDALSRTYRYHIYPAASRNPLKERYAWRVWPVPNWDSLQACARALVGKHDFSAFGTPPRKGGTTMRHVLAANWEQVGLQDFVFEVTANAFLYHMVRRMALIQVEIGQGRLAPETLLTALQGGTELIQGIAPACGLALVQVTYPAKAMAASKQDS